MAPTDAPKVPVTPLNLLRILRSGPTPVDAVEFVPAEAIAPTAGADIIGSVVTPDTSVCDTGIVIGCIMEAVEKAVAVAALAGCAANVAAQARQVRNGAGNRIAISITGMGLYPSHITDDPSTDIADGS